MKTLLIAAMLAAPIAAPAHAADLSGGVQAQESRMGAFVGARLRIALGETKRDRVRAGLALAPTLHRMDARNARIGIGEGVEFGLTERRAPGVSLAGLRISDMQRGPEGTRRNVSTGGWIAIGAGAVLLAGAVTLGWLFHEGDQNTE
jgi:opacity protein-like surface antigen